MIDTLTEALICGIVWVVTNLVITRGLNPNTKGYTSFYVQESMYGGLAVMLNVLIIYFLNRYFQFC